MSSAADPTAAFLALIRSSGLLVPSQVQSLAEWAGAERADVQALAREVCRRGWLTPFQIREIFKGRGGDLILGRYVFLDLLGEGGMGRVYKAHDTRLGRDVALKVIRKEKLKHPAAESRFHSEIQALAKMKHPNVVEVFNADQVGDTHYYEMELVDGTDLTKLVRERGPLPIREACDYIRQAALGLQHAHEQGLVHRDIKPSNILVSRSGAVVKLVDLGLARILGAEQTDSRPGRVTQDGFVIGTPDFLPPEQARDPAGVDIRADIYALGATLYYLLTGRVPYEGANATEKLVRHHTDPPPALLPHRPDAPPQLEQLIHWCMAKQPEFRPQTPLQLALALQLFCSGDGTPPAIPIATAANPGPTTNDELFRLPSETTRNPVRRRSAGGFPWGVVLVGLGALFVVAVLGYAIYLQFGGKPDAPVESFTNSLDIRMVKLDGGTFRMGSPDNEPGRRADEGPQREVTIPGPFLMAATEVSHSQFLKVMGKSQTKSADKAARAQHRPAEWLSWDEANDFCRKLTEVEKDQPWARKGWAYRLPTEAEWEYAARAGTDTPFAYGDKIVFEKQALYRPTDDDPHGVIPAGTAPKEWPFALEVGKTEPNRLGLFDMHGNVAEWCLDWYKPGYSSGSQDDLTGPADGDKRVVRGGSFKTPPADTRSAARHAVRPNERRDDVGFRIVYAPVQK